MTCKICEASAKYFYRVAHSEKDNLWFVEIALRDKDEKMNTLTVLGAFDTEKETIIAAEAFMEGLTYFEGIKSCQHH